MRKLSDTFLQDLKSGFLSGLMARVRQDIDLDLEIRQDYLNIYYKGNSLLKLQEICPGQYRVVIHPKLSGNTQFQDLTGQATADLFLAQIPQIKENILQHGKSSLEIEYEQLIIRANNCESRNNSEYFIVDRQVTAGKAGRFDLTGFYWPRKGRRRDQVVSACLFEVKFALNRDIQDVHQQLERYYQAVKERPDEIAAQTQTMLRQKLELGLFKQPPERLAALKTLTLSPDLNNYRFILLLVDYNPNSQLFARSTLARLPFASQVRVLHTGFALWDSNLLPVTEIQ
mgnify:FL=1